MGAIQRRIALMALVVLPVPGWTGNRALMEQNAHELVGVNQAILEALTTGIQEGEYRLSARVTGEPDHPLFQVDRLTVSVPARPEGGAGPTLPPVPWNSGSPTATPSQGGPGGPGGMGGLGGSATPDVLAPFGQVTPSLRFGPIPDQVEMAAAPVTPATITPVPAERTGQDPTPPLDLPARPTASPSPNPTPSPPILEEAKHPLPPVTTGGGSVLSPR